MNHPIKPVNGKVLLKVEKLTKISKIHRNKPKTKTQYRVISISNNTTIDKNTDEYKVGDLVIADISKGQGRQLGKREYILIAPEFIFGVVEEE